MRKEKAIGARLFRVVSRFSTLILVLWSAAGTSSAEEPIRVFAAASLTEALSAVVSDFERAHPSTRVVFQFGGSSDLARQILAGAPADLFISADRPQLERIAREGLIEKGTSTDLLSNELVVVRPRDESDRPDKPDGLEGPEDLEALGRIAMADPETVPAGVYARQYFEARGLWSRLRTRVVPTLDVRGALAAVASGNVDAGVVYRTDAAIEPRVKIVYRVPREEGPTIAYLLGILEGRDRRDVRALYDYLRSQAAGEVFVRFGFLFLDAEQ